MIITGTVKFTKHSHWIAKTMGMLFMMITVLETSYAACLPNTSQNKPHIVFLISKDPNNYEAHKTIPKFAETLRREYGFKVSVLLGEGERTSFRFPGLEVLSGADLLVIFARRIALQHQQLNAIKDYLNKGKPLIGIRTANHAFSLLKGEVPKDGYEAWDEFVPDILGCKNRGYGPTELGTDVEVVQHMANHPILKGIEPDQWHSTGNVYLVAPLLDKEATVLLTGKVGNRVEPIAWTRIANGSRVFYTSLGYPDDFENRKFRNLLINGIHWALNDKSIEP